MVTAKSKSTTKRERRHAAKALYTLFAQRVSPKDLSHVEALKSLFSSLAKETDRGAALMACAYLDVQLTQLLEARLVQKGTLTKALFAPTGPLASFSVRIDLAYLLGFIPSSARCDLHLIRKIRNEFAHNASLISFDTQALAGRAKVLKFDHLTSGTAPRLKFNRAIMWLVDMLYDIREQAPRISECPEDYLSFIKDRASVAETMIAKTISKARELLERTPRRKRTPNPRLKATRQRQVPGGRAP